MVDGVDATQTWSLIRVIAGAGSYGTMATAAVDTADTTITNATIDNTTYSYFFKVTADTNDYIIRAYVKYTTNYI